MAVTWTNEQQAVIDHRQGNLLVSAAAGSGKTAVLVERILSLVTDPEHPVDIDRLLVVTFTRAAAGEMKDRIGRALEERLLQDPENAHLQKQGVLLHHAQINTIDGFCTYVLHNYFHRIDLDPGYRIAEEDDLTLLKASVLDDLLEEEYAAAEPDAPFLRFVEAYGRGKNDRKIPDLILKMHTFSVSDPDPDLWLEHCREACLPETEEELEHSDWMRELLQEAGYRIEGILESAVRLRDSVREHPEAPQAYLPALQSDVALLADLQGKQTYAQLQDTLQGSAFEKLSGKKQAGEDPELRELVKVSRDRIKKQIDELKKGIFALSPEQVLEDLAVIRPHAEELIRLTGRFAEAYTAAKREQNMLDFADLEHLALQILTERDAEGKRHPTAAARELADRFEEVMIDEYQDSNYLQEELLSAVSRKEPGRNNRFMVGDVKQSIYGFRQARPEIFLEKQQEYAADGAAAAGSEATGRRIDLSRNFRSRPQVLRSVNTLFSRLMLPKLGGIVYDDAAALHPGAEYPENPDPAFPETELLLVDRESPAFEDDRSKAAMIEFEAHAAAGRIRACVRSGRLWDAREKTYRPVQYRDCVILLRAAGIWGDTFVRVLQSEGIPAYTASGKGYFTTTEVSVLLHYLRICDNPRQDIPLAAVLRSPIASFSDEELARVRLAAPKKSLYEALQETADPSADPETGAGSRVTEPALRDKAARFLEQLERFRERVPHTPVSVLIRQILAETGYGYYAAAMPAGAQRQANLDMLAERAAAYEKADYHGLFRFIRYMEQLKEREVDYGEVSLYGEEENIVRIMTIHKSKGLEFPVVILAGLGSGFNRMDEKSPVVLHRTQGIGMEAVYTDQHRIRSNTLLKTAVRQALHRDAMAEELRVLYVAMTRAREKLILIGTDDGKHVPASYDGRLTYQQLIQARSYLDWILMASGEDTLQKTVLRGGELVTEEISETFHSMSSVQELQEMLAEGKPGMYAPAEADFLQKAASFVYPKPDRELPAKITVTELKRRQYVPAEGEEPEEALYPEETPVPYIPAFALQKERDALPETFSGAARGTAYHHVLAVLDYGRIDNGPEDVQVQMEEMKASGLLSEPEYASVQAEDIWHFLQNPLGIRMAKAAAAGKLHREQPFVLDVPAGEVFPEYREEENKATASDVLIQGTIDAYWEEDGTYILLDYKTDRTAPGEEALLMDRYRIQLAYYRLALEQITGIPVRESWIYSVALGKGLLVDRKE